jgi:bifunctional N-acetylglutamate synthase/kinase
MSDPAPDGGDLVLRFLSSIGRPAEAQQYLDLFRSEYPERFAIVHVADAVVRHAADALAVELRYLVELGLEPVLAFGAIEPRSAERDAVRMAEALGPVASRRTAGGAAEVAAVCRANAIPLVTFEREDGGADARFDALADLAGALGTNRLVFVTRRSGLQPTGGRAISIIDLTTERDTWLAPGALPSEQQKLLRQIDRILARVSHRMTVSVTSPLDVLRELFTVKGAGTLVRKGSLITRFLGWDGVDRPRLLSLVESSFGKALVPGYDQRPVLAIYIADEYRGAAIVNPAPLAPYLSKFAVDTVSRGEGVGRDLWRAMAAQFPRLFWRSRADNPITPWYRENSDGMHRIFVGGDPWWVLWRGLAPLEIPAAIEHCQSLAPDFG